MGTNASLPLNALLSYARQIYRAHRATVTNAERQGIDAAPGIAAVFIIRITTVDHEALVHIKKRYPSRNRTKKSAQLA